MIEKDELSTYARNNSRATRFRIDCMLSHALHNKVKIGVQVHTNVILIWVFLAAALAIFE
ncbi:hypothetical protein DWU98_15745 [Dyella monticola]|uniref:Uncharacterized protein n=1 Tax=Dyella monticola TaxID=1927958 RepID=A0A370WUS5_9GAMM|nr:hypothetical protein DWU98_15745 [Dyella monticola]